MAATIASIVVASLLYRVNRKDALRTSLPIECNSVQQFLLCRGESQRTSLLAQAEGMSQDRFQLYFLQIYLRVAHMDLKG